jgi:hypothetical protein
MTLPIMIGDGSASPLRPPICVACVEGEHEVALRHDEWCGCPCHGEVAANV